VEQSENRVTNKLYKIN